MNRTVFAIGLLAAVATVASAASAEEPAPVAPNPPPALSAKAGLSTPESVLYDATSDTYLVSNINGKPLDKDNNGYIAELAADGNVKTAKLVEGGKNGVTLHAPKGSALKDGLLYVADIDVVRIFDRKTGASKGEIAIPGATFLNDVALGPGGDLFVSDSGLTPSFESNGGDAVYRVKTGAKPTVTPFVKSTDLHGPNGLLITKDAVHVLSFGAPEIHSFDLSGQKKGSSTLPNGGLDGVVALGDELLVSSWGGKALYRGKAGGTFSAVVTDLEAPADIGYDPKRGRVLVPRFMGNAVDIWDIK